MGYTTYFVGSFKTDRPVSQGVYRLLYGLATTRRMKRCVSDKYGIEGEFYIRQDDKGVIEKNHPPSTQPSLHCGWKIAPDYQTIKWDGTEKFYEYIEWLLYITRLLKKHGYILKGEVMWHGEEPTDIGLLRLNKNSLTITRVVQHHSTQPEIRRSVIHV